VAREVLARHRTLRRRHTGEPPGPFLLVDHGHVWRHGTREEPVAVPDGTLAATFCEADGRYYAITHHALYAVDTAGNAQPIPAPGHSFSWLGGITYDTTRRRLLIATCWHTGSHHLYDPIAASWTRVPVEESIASIAAIAYDATSDAVFALANPLFSRPLLIKLSPDLRPKHREPSAGSLACGNIGPARNAVAQMAAFPNALVLCIAREPSPIHLEDAPQRAGRRGFIVQLDTGRI